MAKRSSGYVDVLIRNDDSGNYKLKFAEKIEIKHEEDVELLKTIQQKPKEVVSFIRLPELKIAYSEIKKEEKEKKKEEGGREGCTKIADVYIETLKKVDTRIGSERVRRADFSIKNDYEKGEQKEKDGEMGKNKPQRVVRGQRSLEFEDILEKLKTLETESEVEGNLGIRVKKENATELVPHKGETSQALELSLGNVQQKSNTLMYQPTHTRRLYSNDEFKNKNKVAINVSEVDSSKIAEISEGINEKIQNTIVFQVNRWNVSKIVAGNEERENYGIASDDNKDVNDIYLNLNKTKIRVIPVLCKNEIYETESYDLNEINNRRKRERMVNKNEPVITTTENKLRTLLRTNDDFRVVEMVIEVVIKPQFTLKKEMHERKEDIKSDGNNAEDVENRGGEIKRLVEKDGENDTKQNGSVETPEEKQTPMQRNDNESNDTCKRQNNAFEGHVDNQVGETVPPTAKTLDNIGAESQDLNVLSAKIKKEIALVDNGDVASYKEMHVRGIQKNKSIAPNDGVTRPSKYASVNKASEILGEDKINSCGSDSGSGDDSGSDDGNNRNECEHKDEAFENSNVESSEGKDSSISSTSVLVNSQNLVENDNGENVDGLKTTPHPTNEVVARESTEDKTSKIFDFDRINKELEGTNNAYVYIDSIELSQSAKKLAELQEPGTTYSTPDTNKSSAIPSESSVPTGLLSLDSTSSIYPFTTEGVNIVLELGNELLRFLSPSAIGLPCSKPSQSHENNDGDIVAGSDGFIPDTTLNNAVEAVADGNNLLGSKDALYLLNLAGFELLINKDVVIRDIKSDRVYHYKISSNRRSGYESGIPVNAILSTKSTSVGGTTNKNFQNIILVPANLRKKNGDVYNLNTYTDSLNLSAENSSNKEDHKSGLGKFKSAEDCTSYNNYKHIHSLVKPHENNEMSAYDAISCLKPGQQTNTEAVIEKNSMLELGMKPEIEKEEEKEKDEDEEKDNKERGKGKEKQKEKEKESNVGNEKLDMEEEEKSTNINKDVSTTPKILSGADSPQTLNDTAILPKTQEIQNDAHSSSSTTRNRPVSSINKTESVPFGFEFQRTQHPVDKIIDAISTSYDRLNDKKRAFDKQRAFTSKYFSFLNRSRTKPNII